MKITFTRSGGFAGPAMRVEGEIDFQDGKSGKVVSSTSNYDRALSPEEVSKLQSAGAAMGVAQAQSAPDSSQARDDFQYDITVQTKDGTLRSLTIRQGQPAEKGMAPDLFRWIQDEAQKIWTHRVAERKRNSQK